jgi:hypothetical protein
VVRTPRTRSRTVTISGNMYKANKTGVYSLYDSTSFISTSTSIDSIGRPVVNSAFYSNQVRRTLALDGVAVGLYLIPPNTTFGPDYLRFDHYPPGSMSLGGLTIAEFNVPGGWYLDVVARTNPSRPVVTPASLIQDLVELPSMLRDIGRLLTKPKKLLTAKELANQNLAVRFGWVPLIRDINQLLDLQSAVLKRQRELRKLYSGKGLRRRVTLRSDTQNAGSAWTAIAFGLASNITYAHDITIVRKQWATIRWRPTSQQADVNSDVEMNRLARRVVLGLTPEGLAKGTWDVIPWTWLLGWFTNVGQLLLATSNTVPASHTEACLMTELRCTIVPKPVSTLNCISSSVVYSGVYIETIKNRTISGSLTPGFNMPFLDMFRLSILSSLFVQRFKR